MLAVGLEVEVGAVGDALELAPRRSLELEFVLDVDGPLGVVRQLLLRVLEETQVVRIDAEAGVPVHARLDPGLVPLLIRAGGDEELHLHLLELARAEDEVAGRDLVAEALADLTDAERRLLAGGRHDLGEVDEDALRGLGAEVVESFFGLDRAEVGLEQAVEHARLCPGVLGAAVGAGDEGHVDRVGVVDALLLGVRLLQMVLAIALVAVLALDERIDERGEVAGGRPYLRREDDGGVEAHDVIAALDHRPPPLALDVVLQLDAERAVVPGGFGAAVDLSALIDESATLTETDDAVDG